MPWIVLSTMMASRTIPKPPTAAVPTSSRPMPANTIRPSPATAIMEAMTVMDRDIITVWFKPAKMVEARVNLGWHR